MLTRWKAGCVTALVLAATFGTAQAAETRGATQVAQTQALPKGQPAAPGLPVVDPSVNPCENFFLHACKPWIEANPIPADQSRWGSFNLLAEQNQEILRGILETAAKSPTPATARIGAFYGACMDEAAVEAKGIAPLTPTLDRIAGLKDKAQLPALLADLHNMGVPGLFAFGQQADPDAATMAIARMAEGGLGLPDRDFYFKDDEKSQQQRAAYLAHMEKMFALMGVPAEAAKANAATIMAFETKLAEGWMDRVARRDPLKRTNKQDVATFRALAPGFDWAAYTKALGAPAFDVLNNASPDYFRHLGKVLAETPLETVKTYLTWHTVRAASPWLPKAFVEENFDFYGRTLSGAKELRPRWKRCVSATDNALGEELGQFYVEKAFGPEQKERMLRMVADIQQAFYDNVPTLAWMGPETQARAKEKLRAVTNKIGYPDTWRDYAGLEVKRDDLLGNAARSFAFEQAYDLAKIGNPRDPKEWLMTPPTVNAYYMPPNNDINFPAGILQPPFFDKAADDAYNYGAIGGVIGHEITHGFDDQGRKYDAKGNLSNWWTPEDETRFGEKAQCLVDQYGSYVADGDVTLNGKATLGENTADNGGLRIAYLGLKARLGEAMNRKVGGLTADQRFFYGWAHVWCSAARPEARRLQALTGVHSLPEYRVNGTVSNMPEFAKAFNCKPTDAMVRGEKACRVW